MNEIINGLINIFIIVVLSLFIIVIFVLIGAVIYSVWEWFIEKSDEIKKETSDETYFNDDKNDKERYDTRKYRFYGNTPLS